MKISRQKSRKSKTSVKAVATLALAVMAAGTMFIPSPTEAAYPTVAADVADVIEITQKEAAEESSVTEVTEVTEPMPKITEAYIAEVMAGESPYVAEFARKEPAPRYPLTEEERYEIERVMMAECGTEERDGMIAVGQCILNAAEREGIRPTEAIREYKYTPDRVEPSEAVKEAVRAVFDCGEVVTDEPILYFYATYICSEWHESKKFVLQIGVHRFFTEKEFETK